MDLEPGWRPDPTHHHLERWWDGQGWSDRVRDGTEDESTSDFDLAMAAPVEGHDVRIPLWRRTGTRVVVAIAALLVGTWVATGPLEDVLDGLPTTADSAPPTTEGATRTAVDLARAVRNGRWEVVAAYWPDEDRGGEGRRTIAARLKPCFGEDVLGAEFGEPSFDGAPRDARPSPSAGETVRLVVELRTRPETLLDHVTLRLAMRHDGSRWVVVDPLEQARDDGPFEPCSGIVDVG